MAWVVVHCTECLVLLFDPPEPDEVPKPIRRELSRFEQFAHCPVCKEVKVFERIDQLSDL